MKFEKTYVIGAREIAGNNELSNYGFLAFLEDVASTHSDTVGYGVKDIFTKMRAWFLMDWELEVIKRPPFGEKLLLKTWTPEIENSTFHVYRNFEVFNEQGELIANATSKWVFFDMEKGKITKIDKEMIEIYNPEGTDESAKIKIPRLKEPENCLNEFEYQVRRADIDVNKHMHNLDYLKLAYEALPEEVFYGKELNNVHITYKNQIKLGDKVKCLYSFDNEERFITIKNKDTDKVHAIIKLW